MSRQRIAVIDYGMGNLHSVASALQHVAGDSDILVTSDAQLINEADRVIFPGVGAIRDCMAEINRLGFATLVPELIHSGRPVLAICVGMQALMDHSEENGGVDCLGQISGRVKFFGDGLCDDSGARLKVPHMGWNQVNHSIDHPLWQGIADNSRFYFVHSYYVAAAESENVAGRCRYGVDCDVAIAHNNLFAVQFHPEKSHTEGLQLLKNFASWSV